MLSYSGYYKSNNNREQQHISGSATNGVHLLWLHLHKHTYQSCNQGNCSTEREQKGAIQQIDVLIEGGDDNARNCSNESSNQYWHKNIRWLSGSALEAVGHDTDRN